MRWGGGDLQYWQDEENVLLHNKDWLEKENKKKIIAYTFIMTGLWEK